MKVRNSLLALAILALSVPALSAQRKPPDACICGEIEISSGVAEKLLLHRVDVRFPNLPPGTLFSDKVVVAFEIDETGRVRNAGALTASPARYQKIVLNAVRKYRYKPYLLNGKPVVVETVVSVPVPNA